MVMQHNHFICALCGSHDIDDYIIFEPSISHKIDKVYFCKACNLMIQSYNRSIIMISSNSNYRQIKISFNQKLNIFKISIYDRDFCLSRDEAVHLVQELNKKINQTKGETLEKTTI